MKIRFTHWTTKPENPRFRISVRGTSFKPEGIWISVNNSWENWLGDNWETWLEGKTCMEVELAKDIKLFIIDSLETFERKFMDITGREYCRLEWNMAEFHEGLKKEYDGLFLKYNTFREYRMDCMYFYSFDCESICVWNMNKLKFKKLEGDK